MLSLVRSAGLGENAAMRDPAESVPDAGSVARTLDDGAVEQFVREEPLVIEVEGQRVVTMRTPGNDRDLALGFLLGEGVIDDPSAVTGEVFVRGDASQRRADTITIAVAARRARVTGRLTRTHEIRSSCGICGLVDADELLDDLPPLLPGVPAITAARVEVLRRRFESTQQLFHRTGACHGAELFGPDDASWGHGEDVGRHNALDKAIGAAARAGHDLAHATAMLSGRAGFDLVLKCLRLRIPIILSVSAASALSFDMCRAAGATLIGFVRPDRSKVYLSGGRFR